MWRIGRAVGGASEAVKRTFGVRCVRGVRRNGGSGRKKCYR